jgi:hypothetical protein
VAPFADAAGEHRKHRAENHDPERGADHARGVDETGRGARARRGDIGDRDGVHRTGVEAEAAADHEHRRFD